MPPTSRIILLADDDPDDRLLTEEALREARPDTELKTVRDGQELLEYLSDLGPDSPALPSIILLDLNMPRMDGREALAALKRLEAFRHIPVVVLTTSNAEDDVIGTYQLGVSSFITKPATFRGLVDVLHVVGQYWLDVVRLPPHQ